MTKKILLLFLSLLYATKSFASISIYPYAINFEDQSRKRVQSVRIINDSDERKTYRVSVINNIQDAKGRYTETENEADGKFAKKHLSFSPHQFSLKPKETQTINVARRALVNLPDGEYVSYLRVREVELGAPKETKESDSDSLSISLKPLMIVEIPVTIEKGKDLYSKTEIESVKKVNANTLAFVLKRLGNKSSRVNIKVLNEKEKEIAILKSVKIYLSTTTLNINVTSKEKLGKNITVILEDEKTKKKVLRKNFTL